MVKLLTKRRPSEIANENDVGHLLSIHRIEDLL